MPTEDSIAGFEILQENTSLSNYLRGSKGSETESISDDEEILLHRHEEEDEYAEYAQECREAAKEWRVHRFDPNSWDDKNKPYVQLRTYDDLKFTEDEKNGILSERIIAACSSHLQMLPEIHRMGLVKCILSHKQLRDISALKFYHYFQYLDLSCNKLRDLSVLGQLPFLTHLNASHNRIETALNFKAPFNLTKVNLAYNKIKKIPDLSEFWSITDLNLAHNEISLIEGLENLRFLSSLNLSNNSISKLGHLNNLNIQNLQLQHNHIDKTTQNFSLKTVCHLRYINLSYNKLDTLWFFEDAYNIEEIDMSGNKISNLMNLYYLGRLRYLIKLSLSENPICTSIYFKAIIVSVLKHVRILDGEKFDTSKMLRKVENEDAAMTQAAEGRINLLLLQQVNKPDIGDHIFPYDQPPPPIFMLVGPPGSKKRELSRRFCAIYSTNGAVRGVSHTTRKQNPGEIHGDDYYFIDKETFTTMIGEGRFVACSEFLGEYYGIASSELAKANDGVLIFHGDIQVALTMKIRSINPKLILALPFAEDHHVKTLLNKYCRMEENGTYYIRNCPEEAKKIVEKFEENLRKIVIDDIRNIVYEMVDTVCTPNSEPDSGVLILDSSSRWSEGSKTAKGSRLSVQDCDFIMDDTVEISDTDIIFYESTQNNFRSRQYNYSSSNKASASAINYFSSSEFTQEFAESIQTFFGDQMSAFFNSIIKSRNELLELHWSNPGLFREIIFTDNENECMKKLKDVLRHVIKSYKNTRPVFTNFRKEPCTREYLGKKIEYFFNSIYRELSISDKQYQESTKKFFYPHTHTCQLKATCLACIKCYVE